MHNSKLSLIDDIVLFLDGCSNQSRKKVIILTGGNSIQHLYNSEDFMRILSKFDHILFSDDRLVPWGSPRSNIGSFLRKYKGSYERIVSLTTKFGLIDKNNCRLIESILYSSEFSIYAISGFGLDGHVWSLFSKQDMHLKGTVVKTQFNEEGRVSLGFEVASRLDRHVFISSYEKASNYFGEFLNHNLLMFLNFIYLVDIEHE